MKKTKQSKGITLIALVITIIILLILAGISIMMLTGDNGLLTKAVIAKEETEMAEIKEKADLVKADLIAENAIKDAETKNTDVAKAINEDTTYFSGSSLNGINKVVTANEKYDIIVEENLDITVVKHIQTSQENIELSCEEIEIESRTAVILKVTVKEEQSVNEWLRTLSEEELKQTLVDGYLSIAGIKEQMTWKQFCELVGQDFDSVEDLLNAMGMEESGYSDIYEFMEAVGLCNGRYTLTCNGESIKVKNDGEFVIKANGEYTVTATSVPWKRGSAVAKITKCENEKYSAIQEKNTTLKIDGYDVTIPAGFGYGISENVGHVNTGLVITDAVDSEGNSMGNEFVWVPVQTVVSDTEANGTINKAMAVNMGTDENPKYRGLLYRFNDTGSSVIEECTTTTIFGREPDILSDYDNNLYYNNGLFTKDSLQNEYNEMIESVKKNKGFYVARYEMGVDKNEHAISKLGEYPATNRNWYRLYSLAKTYMNNKSSIVSNMIWGSQWDAMINFALLNGAKVTEYPNTSISEEVLKTGFYKASDCINNVYDLGGGVTEFSQTAYWSMCRTIQGDFCYYEILNPSESSTGFDSITSRWDTGSRFTLYIK